MASLSLISTTFFSTPLCTFVTRFQPANYKLVSQRSSAASSSNSNIAPKQLLPVVASSRNIEHNNVVITRRSGNYPPTIWHDDYLQSIKRRISHEASGRTEGGGEIDSGKSDGSLGSTQVIDNLERLGLSYYFEDEIMNILTNIFINRENNPGRKEEDLFATSLEFRLLRQHGFRVPQEVFNQFKDEKTGNFKPVLSTDTKGLLSLYEASYLSLEGETLLDDAKVFAATHLVENLDLQKMDKYLDILVRHALEIPLHWRMPRQEARWFVEIYSSSPDLNPIILQLAKLNYNIVQAIHQSDLKAASRWWSNMGFGEHLSFARDRVVENFIWTVGEIFEPKYGYGRVMSTKVNALLTTIDDVYDVYGTLDELVLFTDAIERWDINSIEQLPHYMKICFHGLYNSVNEMAFDILKEQGFHVISYLKKTWADISKCYLKEARWYYSEYTPTLDEYLDNAWMSCAAPVMLVHLYYFTSKPITKDAMKCLEDYSSLVRRSCTIVRLIDDLGTASHELKRGDVPKSIQCYMKETGASEEEGRTYIRKLIGEKWKKLNENLLEDSPLPRHFIKSAVNITRMTEWMYQYGDAHGVTAHANKDRLLPLLIDPFIYDML